MKTIDISEKVKGAAQIGIGCMRIGEMTADEVNKMINTAYELGYNFFDHANIYGRGKCETLFGDALKMNPGLREKLFIQTKCGITNGRYCFDKEHILKSVDESLKRLNTDYIDILLLHRPDILMEPEQVAEAFDILEASGKVRTFGMSNQNSMQLELLQKYLKQKIAVNQLQFSPTNTTMLDSGVNVNTENASATDRDGYVRDYCRLHGITVQPWSPFQFGFFDGVYLGNERFPELNKKIDEIAEKYGITNSAAVIAWMLRMPDNLQPILGTINLSRITAISKAADVRITHEEWYDIYKAAGNKLP